ncbi:ParB family chromosome partitioning protein [Variovorax boronicumulans]|uniref:ParB/RepB/Spo0J family partition protein n=1 Tax=Variovorax boronicumulans TaxID=436515 RepID=UPI002789244D|nr:ParB/RepB/Spo0J family partition protein [Variovorax boronicumulans]MDP9995279.1 ParB family chromosome partitioning protein [Variovorax boronicumulans]MDQ0006569.1 ParB family chromosome partitioning protein [Variovorax boronicumulans]
MNAPDGLDLSVLSQFRAVDLLAGAAIPASAGTPMQVPLDRIDFDPGQPRRRIRGECIDELAESIREHGVLEPVSLRNHPEHAERYIVNRGERRVRAARRAGLATVPAFVDPRIDPFAQAAENLHREDMSPFDLATFIAEREAEGHSRAEIARRLGKPRSFITEAARLSEAPPQLRQAVEQGRVAEDVRALYRLVTVARDCPAEFEALLAQGGTIGRAQTMRRLKAPGASAGSASAAPGHRSPAIVSAGRTVLVVEHGGRRGSLRIKAKDGNVGEVRFGDGTRALLPLTDLRLVCWATED